MNTHSLVSDQLNTWSDIYAKYFVIHFAQTSRAVAAAYAGFGHALARLAHRTLQTLRQTWLQVCRRPRPWPQVLFVGELPRHSTANGLRATSRSGRRRRAPGELPSGPRDHRGSLRDQPRTVTPPRSALRRPGEPAATIAHPVHRSASCRRADCQYARGVAHHRIRAWTERGELR
jgi:hypothetical protein